MLSTTSQYALRALVRLAREPEGASVLGRDLARDCEIPANYLSKVLLQLKNASVVSTARGSGGGYKLERRAEHIRLLDVVDIFDPRRTRQACLLGQGECSDQDACTAHHGWKHVRKAYLDFLESNSLADIAEVNPRPTILSGAILPAR